MPTSKIATLTFRIELGLKEALCFAARQEHRSHANMVEVEVLIRDYCKRNDTLFANERGTAQKGCRSMMGDCNYNKVAGLKGPDANAPKTINSPTSSAPIGNRIFNAECCTKGSASASAVRLACNDAGGQI